MPADLAKRLVLVTLLALVVGGAPVWAASPETPSSPVRYVRHIRFVGVKGLSPKELKKVMETRVRRFRWFGGEPLDERVLAKDLERIEKLYRSQGYYDARVVGHRLLPLVGSNYILEIEVDEGQPVLVESVQLFVDGKASSPWHKELVSNLPVRPGERFTTPAYEHIDRTIRRFLAEWGYARAKVTTRGILDKRARKARLRVDVQMGPPCYFGPITIEGNRKVDAKIIRRELNFREGERFRTSAVTAAQRRLMNTRLFSFVNVQVVEEGDTGPRLPIHVVVKEAKSQSVRFGVGYGTEDKLRGILGWEYRNFLGGGRDLQVRTKASSLARYVDARLLQPHLLGFNAFLTSSAGYSREIQESFENEQYYVRNQWNVRESDRLLLYLAHNLEANRLLDLSLEPDEVLGAEKEGENYFVSSLVAGSTYQRVDDLLDPHRGWQVLQRLEWGSGWLASDVSFLKLSLEGRAYLPLDPLGVLAMRARWGSIKELEDTTYVPIFKRYFTGGSNSVRGYPYQKLGPLDDSGNPLGGLTVVEANLDWRFPLKNSWEGVLFLDAGNVYPSSYELVWDQLRFTTGVGLRYKTPVGPLRVDVGYQLNPPSDVPFNRYQIHFSIGHAF
ncbi:outer membrane protein assembly factor BamA [Desulfacinum hydrothermale]|nr:outer membrane protein assembly factor BamA [Desulfacinum hydrothermale]